MWLVSTTLDPLHLAHARNKAGWYLMYEFACSAGPNRMVTCCLNNMTALEGKTAGSTEQRGWKQGSHFSSFHGIVFSEPGQVDYRLYWLLLNKLIIIRWADILKKKNTPEKICGRN